MKKPTILFRQQGVSLVVTLVLVVLLSLLALYGAGVLVMDTRSAANDYRAKEALSAAESGLDQGFSLLNANRFSIRTNGLDLNGDGDVTDTNEAAWNTTTCTSSSTVVPCVTIRPDDRENWQYLQLSSALIKRPWKDDDNDGVKDASEQFLGNSSVYLMTPKAGGSAKMLYNIVASGTSADNTGSAIVKQAANFHPHIVSSPKSPMMSYGEIGGSGTFDVVTNPDGAGSGNPLSAWSRYGMTLGGSGKTCQVNEFLNSKGSSFWTEVTDSYGNTLTKCSSCSCPSATGINPVGSDIVANDPDFPDDVFAYLFGVPYTSYAEVKKNAKVVSDCSTLNTNSSGLIWVTPGPCNITSSVGSYESPVLLVVQDTTVSVTGGGEIFGLLFVFGSSGYSATATDVHLAGGTTLYGAIMTNTKIDLGNGTYRMRFDQNVLNNISRNPSGGVIRRVPGSWSDVQVE